MCLGKNFKNIYIFYKYIYIYKYVYFFLFMGAPEAYGNSWARG